MKLGRVIGRVVCATKHGSLDGLKLLLVQPVDEKGKDAGAAIVAFDTVRAGVGDRVFYEGGKEAAQANPNGWFNPADAAIIGIVDEVDLGSGSVARPGGRGPGGTGA
jgi:ethanolamine utilization protein EutN